MPAATQPTPGAAATKPRRPGAKPGAGKTGTLSKKAAVVEAEEEEDKPTHPSILVIAAVAVLVMLFVLYQQYTTDQIISRVTEPTLGWPTSGDGGASASEEASSDEEYSESEESSDEEE